MNALSPATGQRVRLIRFRLRKSVWFENDAEPPGASGTESSGLSVLTLGRERAEAVPQRPVRRPMSLDRADEMSWLNGHAAGIANPGACRRFCPGQQGSRPVLAPFAARMREPLTATREESQAIRWERVRDRLSETMAVYVRHVGRAGGAYRP
jgi:hypothetical protein